MFSREQIHAVPGFGVVVALLVTLLAWSPLTSVPRVTLHGATDAAVAQFPGGGVVNFGNAPAEGGFAGMSLTSPVLAIASAPDGEGYWVAAADGGVFAFGSAQFYGSMGGHPLYAPVVAMAPAPDGKGYWLVASDGGIFAFGSAQFYGSMGGHPLNQPIVGMAATKDGKGYWLVASDGGIFAFGDAAFFGSMGGHPLSAPITGMARTTDGDGYWLVGADGGIFAFGDAPFHGSAASRNLGTEVVGIAGTTDDGGYWLVCATAAILTFGDAVSYGPSPNLPPFDPTIGFAVTPDGGGYWLLQPDAITTSFLPPGPEASIPGGQSVVSLAASQIGPDPDLSQGSYCNPYGPCERWCALFATWAWEQQGFGVPHYAFVGDVYTWATARGLAQGSTTVPAPGDGLIYGTGPQNASTAPHMAIVAQVWPNGDLITIDGDSGPEPDGQMVVTFNGPFLPSQSQAYNGMPLYAFVRP
ncbi:MAG: CHAP domain-containing protein [Acidimicrobiales bacterium]